MPFSVKILADSLSPDNVRLTTVEATMPRIILAEANTHRAFSRNSASSRAIPINKRIQAVIDDPFVPEAFGANKAGMQAGEILQDQEAAKAAWLAARDQAVSFAKTLSEIGVHKQWANRLLEPFAWQTVIISATSWDNFFALRCHPDAQPEIRKIAEMIREGLQANKPVPLRYGEWHLPLIFQEDASLNKEERIKLSVARCARVSYLTHTGVRDTQADFNLYDRLLTSGHLSPMEHVATPLAYYEVCGNFLGWKQHRKFILNENDYSKIKKD